MRRFINAIRTLCMVTMTTLLLAFLLGGVAFAGCNSDIKSTWVYTSPLTGKKYKIDTKIDKENGIKTTTATELKNITNKSWELISPRVKFTYDITGDEGKNVVRIEHGEVDTDYNTPVLDDVTIQYEKDMQKELDRDIQVLRAYQQYLAIKDPNLAPLSEEQFTTIYNRMRSK